MKKSDKRKFLKNIKQFLKLYFYTTCTGLIALKGIDLYTYKDNIYYHNELKISDEELSELEENISKKIGGEVNEEDNSLVLGAVIENNNLTEEEKNTIYRFDKLLNDNCYLDKGLAYDNLKNLNIIYDKDADYGENVLGVYIYNDDEITIIEDNKEKETVLHEIVHCIYSNPYYNKLPRFFDEGMTELLTNEYFSENPFKEESSYPYEILMVKVLCEIVGEDKVLEAYSKEDISIVENELAIKTNLSEPHELIKCMENTTTSLSEKKEIKEDEVNSIIDVLDKYYKNYDKSPIEYEMYLYNRKLIGFLLEDNPYAYNQYNLIINGYYVKPYFSQELKEKYDTPFHNEYYVQLSPKTNEKTLLKTNNHEEK